MDSTLRSPRPLRHAEQTPNTNALKGRYRVRFARTEDDLDAVCKLRFDVFNLELGEGFEESFVSRRDQDQFDAQCQHLMVIDESTGEVVGTYRMQVAEVAAKYEGFYSATEFDLSQVHSDVIGNSVELGRACVARKHRSKKVLFFLWNGLISYLNWNRKRYFFGCSSLTSQDTALGMATYRYLLEHGHAHPSIVAPPLADNDCGLAVDDPCVAAIADRAITIPPLFDMYLRYGAKLIGPPAIDRIFGTIDYLTLIDTAELDPKVIRTFTL